MWVTFVLATANLVIERLVVYDYSVVVKRYVNGVLMTIAAVGFSGFLVNITHFGIDQLHDASTDEITSFISWFIWCAYSSQFITDCIQRGLNCIQTEPQLFGALLICVQLSAALSVDFLFNRWLVREPVTPNPFKLVFNVLKYAKNFKQPRYRSAFTYCEDELPSRIDFGKSKYGGPFTTEQVGRCQNISAYVNCMYTREHNCWCDNSSFDAKTSNIDPVESWTWYSDSVRTLQTQLGCTHTTL